MCLTHTSCIKVKQNLRANHVAETMLDLQSWGSTLNWLLLWLRESTWQPLSLSLQQCLNFQNKEFGQVSQFKLLNWPYRCWKDAVQLDLGCAPNFNQRSSHFIFSHTQNKLGQTSWDATLNCSHLLTWASHFGSPCFGLLTRVKRRMTATTSEPILFNPCKDPTQNTWNTDLHKIWVQISHNNYLLSSSSLSPKRNLRRKMVQK